MLSAKEANRQYFRDAYGEGQHGWSVEEPSPYAIAFLTQLGGLLPGGTLLDIGCGEGRHAFAASQLGFRVTAIDYERLALKRARRFAKIKRISGIKFREADVFRLPFRDASFDIVLDYGCLHHQKKSDWPAYKASILRVMTPRAFYILSVFSPEFRFFKGTRRSWHIAYGAYRRCFTSQEVHRLFERDFYLMNMAEERGKNGGFWHTLMRRRAGTG